MLDFLVSFVPVLLSFCSLIVHFFVFHRLKCTKDLVSCFKEDFSSVRVSSLLACSSDFDERIRALESLFKTLEELVKRGYSN